MECTHQELALNDRRNVELTAYTTTGDEFLPSGASYLIRNLKHSTVIPLTSAYVNRNKIHTQIPLTVTASAGLYEILWEIRKNGETFYHCTRLLVNEAC
jgi:hypothetical protein